MTYSAQNLKARHLAVRGQAPFVSATQESLDVRPEVLSLLDDTYKALYTPTSDAFIDSSLYEEDRATRNWLWMAAQQRGRQLRPDLRTPLDELEERFREVATPEELAAYKVGTLFEFQRQFNDEELSAQLRRFIGARFFTPLKGLPDLKRANKPSFKKMLGLNQAHISDEWINHSQCEVGSAYEEPGRIDGARLGVLDQIKALLPDAHVDLAKKVYWLQEVLTICSKEGKVDVKRFPEQLFDDVVRVTVQRGGITATRDYLIPPAARQ